MPAALLPVSGPPADHPETAPAGAEHLDWLDWLRFLAALLVVVDHTRELNWSGWQSEGGGPHHFASGVLLALGQLGRVAVVVFFVLSGLLVGGKTWERARRGVFDVRSYAADRLARIYVPLVPALGLTAAATFWCRQLWQPERFLTCLAGLQGVWTYSPIANIALWTLSYETWFYVLAGGVAAACARGRTPWGRWAAGAVAALALGMFLRLDGVFLACWMMGAAGYWLDARLGVRRGWLALAGAGIVAGSAAGYEMDRGILPPLPGHPAPWLPQADLWMLPVAAGATLAVVCVMRQRPATSAGARFERLGTRLAAFSYTLYLTHFPVLAMLSARAAKLPPVLDGPSLGRAAAWMAACLVTALGMYALFEAHTPAVRRWLRGLLDGSSGRRGVVIPGPSAPPVPAAP